MRSGPRLPPGHVANRPGGRLVFLVPGSGNQVVKLSEHRLSASYAMPVRLEVTFRIDGHRDPMSPAIAVQTTLVLAGLQARILFRDRARATGSRAEPIVHQVSLISSGERVMRPWQPVQTLPRGSRLALRVADREDHPLGEEWGAGDCEDGLHEATVPFVAAASIVAWVATRDWSEQRGPRLSLSGELALPEGVRLLLGYRLLDGGSPGTLRGGSEIGLVRPGTALYMPEKTVEGGSGGQSWVSVQFLDGVGEPFGEEQLIGRCALV
jgi:hypothetical protein